MWKYTMMFVLLLSACQGAGTSGINLCDELPTVSRNDTDQTIIEVDNFNAKYEAIYCNG